MNREKIKSIIRFKQEQPTKTLQQIGNYFGVSKPYIYKVLKQNSIPTTRVKTPKLTYCLVCEKPIYKKLDKAGNRVYHVRKTCVGKCTFDYYNKEIKCAYCRRSFYRLRSQLIQKYNLGHKFIVCSQHCYTKSQTLGMYSGAEEEFQEIILKLVNIKKTLGNLHEMVR